MLFLEQIRKLSKPLLARRRRWRLKSLIARLTKFEGQMIGKGYAWADMHRIDCELGSLIDQFSIDIPDDLLMKIAAINSIEFEEWGSWNIDAKNSEAFVDESSYLCMASTLAQRELKRRGISAQWANDRYCFPSFEDIDDSLWGNHLALLTHLNDSQPDGDILTSLRHHYWEPQARKLPPTQNGLSREAPHHANYPFKHYIYWLVWRGVIEKVGAKARITQLGTEYLAWRAEHQPLPASQ